MYFTFNFIITKILARICVVQKTVSKLELMIAAIESGDVERVHALLAENDGYFVNDDGVRVKYTHVRVSVEGTCDCTLAMLAAERGRDTCLKLFIDNATDVNAVDENGGTAVTQGRRWWHIHILFLLVFFKLT
jgi:hypothetical protein